MGRIFRSIKVNSAHMDFVEEGQRSLLPPGFQCWPLQFIQHLANMADVLPVPASQAGSSPEPLQFDL